MYEAAVRYPFGEVRSSTGFVSRGDKKNRPFRRKYDTLMFGDLRIASQSVANPPLLKQH
ncbi:hypothetical protein GCM10011571_07510 [Marinithermofilum abyssi]|uniref:Uncharacterized protein n=1 Tax=Marinithermofilum abyssi TaxID=1571185 RepID=A0A8J2YCJ7_9BACL|nr:hypothetical protein GCM10011571_07510 [Marinithermofilum abyssi]